MICYEWRTSLSNEEAAEMAAVLDRAARHDAEAEHNSIDFAAVQHALTGGSESVRHLVIWMLPHVTSIAGSDAPARIAGLVRLVFTADAEADATVVVDPTLRSIGIITLLLEQGGVEPDQSTGWLGSGAHLVRAWARGNHPAAGRISNRFLIPPTRRVWKLIRPASPTAGDGARPADGTLTLTAVPAVSEEFGRYATIEEFRPADDAGSDELRSLLDSGAALAAEAGLDAVAMYVDAEDRALVNACRLTGFQHDRTDVRYQIGGQP